MHPIVNQLDVARYVADIDAQAAAAGITLDVCRDFQDFKDARRSVRNDPLAPIFDPGFTDIGYDNGFWVKGVDDAGEVVHLQAARRMDIRGITLAEHLQRARELYRLPGLDRNLASAEYPAPGARTISGNICYHGEIWLKGGPEGFRGKGLAALLPRMLLALTLAEWAPDFVFGFVPTPIAHKGTLTQYGYMHVQPGGILWKDEEQEDAETVNKWLAWLTFDELIYLLRFAPKAVA